MNNIEQFIETNKLQQKNIEDGFVLLNPWNDTSLALKFSPSEDISVLNDIQLPPKLIAIKHPNKYEFIYMPIAIKEYKEIEPFEFIFEGKIYKAYYSEPTEAFHKIALSIRRKSYDDTNYSNVFIYKSFYQDLIEDKNRKPNERRTKDYKPINFFLEGDFGKEYDESHIDVFRHINFYLKYYDRKSPVIFIDTDNLSATHMDFKEPNFGTFPRTIQAKKIDEALLLLLEAALSSQSYRLKYIFYYQVLEYCAYYYLDTSFKQKIQNIVGSPSFFMNMQNSICTLIEEFQNNYNSKSNSDSFRLEKVIENYCNYDNIKTELITNADFFCKDCEFDGGYKLKALFSSKDEIDKLSNNFYSNLKKRIENLRNVLVHARESREDKTISPTANNANLLKPYLYLIRRIAEEIATNNSCK